VKDLLRAIKPTVFVGSSRKDLQGFPATVRSEIGQALFEARRGEHPHNAKPLKGLSGILEIRDNFDSDTYRAAVYTVRFEGVLYILHAFQKTSTSGISTRQRHIDLVKLAMTWTVRRKPHPVIASGTGLRPTRVDSRGAVDFHRFRSSGAPTVHLINWGALSDQRRS
jgi:phage-related protein